MVERTCTERRRSCHSNLLPLFCWVVYNHHFITNLLISIFSYTNRFPLNTTVCFASLTFLDLPMRQHRLLALLLCPFSVIMFRLRLRICTAYYAAGYREGKCFETINFWIWEVPN